MQALNVASPSSCSENAAIDGCVISRGVIHVGVTHSPHKVRGEARVELEGALSAQRLQRTINRALVGHTAGRMGEERWGQRDRGGEKAERDVKKGDAGNGWAGDGLNRTHECSKRKVFASKQSAIL